MFTPSAFHGASAENTGVNVPLVDTCTNTLSTHVDGVQDDGVYTNTDHLDADSLYTRMTSIGEVQNATVQNQAIFCVRDPSPIVKTTSINDDDVFVFDIYPLPQTSLMCVLVDALPSMSPIYVQFAHGASFPS